MSKREARRELVLRAQQGDRAALAELMAEAVPMVSGLVRAMAPRFDSREDITQEVLLRAMSHLKSLRDPNRFGAYLSEITRNLVYDMSRRARSTVSLTMEPPAETLEPEARLARKEESAGVWEALSGLSERDREVVYLRHWADMSYEEIASTLGLTVSAVQSRLFRARRELAGRLRRLRGEEHA